MKKDSSIVAVVCRIFFISKWKNMFGPVPTYCVQRCNNNHFLNSKLAEQFTSILVFRHLFLFFFELGRMDGRTGKTNIAAYCGTSIIITVVTSSVYISWQSSHFSSQFQLRSRQICWIAGRKLCINENLNNLRGPSLTVTKLSHNIG